MKNRFAKTFLALTFLFVSLNIFTGAAWAAEPVIAPEIGRIIAEEGLDAANARFAELTSAGELDYAVENQGLMVLMTSYMQAGNAEAATAVGDMYAQMMQKMLSGGGNAFPPGMAEAQKAQEDREAQNRADKEAQLQMQKKQQDQSRGKSRDDLARFKGLYSDPKSDDPNRAIFVTVSCDGYLVTGPMWADVGPWWMRSAADTVFTYSDSWTDLSLEFVGEGGRGTRLNHDIEGIISPLENKGPLPDDWNECLERPLR